MGSNGDWKADLQADERAEIAELRREARDEYRREMQEHREFDDEDESYEDDGCPICGSRRCSGWSC
jgi:hypothetical protein